MATTSIRRNDTVQVLAGRDKGKQGRVLKVLPDINRVIVESVNKVKRHTKPNPQKGIKGGIVERESSLHLSNVKLVCTECSAPTRVGHRRDADGTGVRVCKKCGAAIGSKASQ